MTVIINICFYLLNYKKYLLLHGKKCISLTVLKTVTGDLAKYAKVIKIIIFKELGKMT